MNSCGLQEFGKDRAYFDFQNTIDIPTFGIKLAAGYKASLGIYGERILLCTEVAHKIINTQTVLERMEILYRENRNEEDYRSACINELVGSTVVTK